MRLFADGTMSVAPISGNYFAIRELTAHFHDPQFRTWRKADAS
jgi:hypothetical protein